MADASSETRRRFNVDFMQGFVGNLFAMLSPPGLIVMSGRFGWRSTFYIAGVPGLIFAALGFFYIKEPKTSVVIEAKQKIPVSSFLKYRSIM